MKDYKCVFVIIRSSLSSGYIQTHTYICTCQIHTELQIGKISYVENFFLSLWSGTENLVKLTNPLNLHEAD